MVDIGDQAEFAKRKAEELETDRAELKRRGVPDGVRIELPLAHGGHPSMFDDYAEALETLAGRLRTIKRQTDRSVAEQMRDAWWEGRMCDKKAKDRAKPPLNVVKISGHPLDRQSG